MTSPSGRKRRRDSDKDAAALAFGVGTTLAHLTADGQDADQEQDSSDNLQWQKVERKESKKKRKTNHHVDDKRNYPAFVYSPHNRLTSSVKLRDIQLLILYLVANGDAPHWIAVRHRRDFRKVVALTVPGLEMGMFDGSLLHSLREKAADEAPSKRHSPDDYYPQQLEVDKLPDPVKPLAEIFDRVWPVNAPGDRNGQRMFSPLQAILTAPIQKQSTPKNSRGPQPPRYANKWSDQPTHVSHYLATLEQLQDDDYVIHPALFDSDDLRLREAPKRIEQGQTEENGWKDSPCEPWTEKIDDSSDLAGGMQVLAIDCEMCKTGQDEFELTRISVVDWDGNVVMDELVMPTNPIVDYVTQWSGMTEEKLKGVTTTLKDIQDKLLALIDSKTVLVGHSLNSDLNALKLTHPLIIDTSILLPHPRGPPLKSSLKFLTQRYLSREIQTGQMGHNSVEDARAALDLVKQKCIKGPQWGTEEANGEPLFTRVSRSSRSNDASLKNFSVCVDWGVPKRGHGAAADAAIGCRSDHEVVESVLRAINGDEDGFEIPASGADFTWARLRELEAVRGWWTESGTGPDTKTLWEQAVDSNKVEGSEEQDSLNLTVSKTVSNIKQIWDALPPCTALIVYSGNGDPRELIKYQNMYKQHKNEYRTKKWDELSIQWTDQEDNALRAACERARSGVAFVAVK